MELQELGSSARRWGPLFGARARDWADTWEGPTGWGQPVYEHVLERCDIGAGVTVLDCGCGAGRFLRHASERGAQVAGIDASAELVAIARARNREADVRVGDMESLPWGDDRFDVVTGFSAFQFADDKQRALSEAARVSRGPVVVVVPTRPSESGIATVLSGIMPLFPTDAVAALRESGIFSLSAPGALEEALAGAGLDVDGDEELAFTVTFDAAAADVAFRGAGPVQLAIDHSGEDAVGRALGEALAPFAGEDGTVHLPAWFRVVVAQRR